MPWRRTRAAMSSALTSRTWKASSTPGTTAPRTPPTGSGSRTGSSWSSVSAIRTSSPTARPPPSRPWSSCPTSCPTSPTRPTSTVSSPAPHPQPNHHPSIPPHNPQQNPPPEANHLKSSDSSGITRILVIPEESVQLRELRVEGDAGALSDRGVTLGSRPVEIDILERDRRCHRRSRSKMSISSASVEWGGGRRSPRQPSRCFTSWVASPV